MKRIMLGTVKLNGSDNPIAAVLKEFLRPYNPQTDDLEKMRQRIKLMDALEAAKDAEFIDVEDAQYNELVRVVRHPPVNVADPAIIEVADKVLSAKEPPKAAT